MQAIRSPEIERISKRRVLDTRSIDCRILVAQDSTSQTNNSPLSKPLPRKVVAMPNTTPESRIKRSLWLSFPSPCFSMALA